MKSITSLVKRHVMGITKLIPIPILLIAMLATGLLSSSPVYAQTRGEALDCRSKFDGQGGVLDGPIVLEFLHSDCQYKNNKGNCMLFDNAQGPKTIYCSTQPDTQPRGPLTSPGSTSQNCVGQEDLSFNWGQACTDSTSLINIVFGLLGSLVGVAVVIGIVWGGMLYATSNGNGAKAQQGITVIVNAVIGLLIFIFLFAITNFLVPGGIFHG